MSLTTATCTYLLYIISILHTLTSLTALNATHESCQAITLLDIMEELGKWWRKQSTEGLAAYNTECAKKWAALRKVEYRPNERTAPRQVSQAGVYYWLQERYPRHAMKPGNIPRWLPLVNCDNVQYLFDRLAEPDWPQDEEIFTQHEILVEFGGMCMSTCPTFVILTGLLRWRSTDDVNTAIFKAAVDEIVQYRRSLPPRETRPAKGKRPERSGIYADMVQKWSARRAAMLHATEKCKKYLHVNI